MSRGFRSLENMLGCSLGKKILEFNRAKNDQFYAALRWSCMILSLDTLIEEIMRFNVAGAAIIDLSAMRYSSDGEKCLVSRSRYGLIRIPWHRCGALVKMCGMPYTNGGNTVTFVGSVFFIFKIVAISQK